MDGPLVEGRERGVGQMPQRGKAIRVGFIENERGAATAEYVPLLVVIAILVVVAVSFAGPWISDQLSDASDPMEPNAWSAADSGSSRKR